MSLRARLKDHGFSLIIKMTLPGGSLGVQCVHWTLTSNDGAAHVDYSSIPSISMMKANSTTKSLRAPGAFIRQVTKSLEEFGFRIES